MKNELQEVIESAPKQDIHNILDEIILSVTKLRQFITSEGLAQDKLDELKMLLKEK